MNIEKLLKYMYALERFGSKPGLDVITKLLKALENPHKGLKYIHIAGTNGKGSVAAMLESILRKAGYKTGMYTSPHLVKFNERIRISNKEISDEEIARLVEKIKKASEENDLQPTFFELTTALAFMYFKEKQPDYILLETGMGGRLDATNVVEPVISIITNIGIDHVNFLGNSKKEIAYEKSKIIKKGVPLITAETNEEVLKVFRKECRDKSSDYYNTNNEFRINISESDTEHQIFSKNGDTYELKLLGEHQVSNASIAVKAAEMLSISSDSIRKGLKETKWLGRLQIIRNKPLIIIDSAHNVSGMKALTKFLKKFYPRVLLVFGMIDGEHKKDMLEYITPFAEKIILTQGKYRGEDPESYKDYIEKEAIIIRDVKEAVRKAMKMNGDLPILITGSIYMIGEAEELFVQPLV